MNESGFLGGTAFGLVVGALIAWLWVRGNFMARAAAAVAERDVLRQRVDDLELARVDDTETASLLAPLRDTIGRVEHQVGVLERDRSTQFGELGERLAAVSRSTESLRSETATLAGALKSSNVRGSWGEIQLRRVLELSGLLARCDFDEQVPIATRAGTTGRPDAVINLPGSRHLVVDSKAPMTQFLRAQASGLRADQRGDLLSAHARALRGHVDTLAAKAYWSAFDRAPEVVILFVPGEAMLAAALDHDPSLFEHALHRKVVLASPATLYAVLKTIGTVWQQDSLEQHARELLSLGKDLHTRLSSLGGHVASMGTALTRSVEEYNRFVGTLESRVLVTTRRMHEIQLVEAPPPEFTPLTVTPRSLSAAELTGGISRDASDDTGWKTDAPGHEVADGLGDQVGRGARDAAFLESERGDRIVADRREVSDETG